MSSEGLPTGHPQDRVPINVPFGPHIFLISVIMTMELVVFLSSFPFHLAEDGQLHAGSPRNPECSTMPGMQRG